MDNVSFFVPPTTPPTTHHPSASPGTAMRDLSRAGSLPRPPPSLPPRPAFALNKAPSVTPFAIGLGAIPGPEPSEARLAVAPSQGPLHWAASGSAGYDQAGQQPSSPCQQLSSSPLGLNASVDPTTASQPGLTETPNHATGEGDGLVVAASATQLHSCDAKVSQLEDRGHSSASITHRDDLVLVGIYGYLDTWKSQGSWCWKFQAASPPSEARAQPVQITWPRPMSSPYPADRRRRRRRFSPKEDADILYLRDVEHLTWA